MFTWLASFAHPGTMSAVEIQWLARLLATTPGLARGLIHTPAATHDPYLDDGRPPALVLQAYFADIAALEAALAPDGHLQALAARDAPASLAGAAVTQQAMLARAFAVPAPAPDAAVCCSYLVAYDATTPDLNAWLSHYIAHHTAVMADFPAIRAIEVCTRLDWCGGLPWPRAHAMLRNTVVFDDAAALTAALNSPVRHAMRADFQRFPPFTGSVTHFPVLTRRVAPG
jgi:hypothetical protein